MNTDNNKLKLTISPSTQAADGSSTIEAEATAYIDQDDSISYPDPPVEIVFELPEGKGVAFKGSPTATTTSRKTLTDSGRIESPVYFYSDKAIKDGTLTAYWKDDKENTLQQQTFTFTATDDYALDFTTPPPSNNQPANGSAANMGQVVVTDQQNTLSDAVVVKFEFKEGLAKFVLTDNPYIQAHSNETTLYVLTHKNENGQDVAEAAFTANSNNLPETVILQASLRDYTDVPPTTQKFSFTVLAGLVTLQAYDNTYWSLYPVNSEYGPVTAINCEKTEPDSNCVFTAIPIEGDLFALLCPDGKYVTVYPEGEFDEEELVNFLVSSDEKPGLLSIFKIDYSDNGSITFQWPTVGLYVAKAGEEGALPSPLMALGTPDPIPTECYFTLTNMVALDKP
ncbi:fascin domain-containing protein [Phyllobacterium phragmitis]|uniref:Uncharacterized protein n=1 Tax=Phyllobacterium phragmitis TaxID=2670329 RepID=A0ABQ0H746_9HYPH